MLKVTKEDLQRRSVKALTSLFNHINNGVGPLANPSPERSSALALLAMIRSELAVRDRAP